MWLALVSLYFLAAPAFAGPVQVVILDPEFDADLLGNPDKKFEIKRLEDLPENPTGLPGLRAREASFTKAGLLKFISHWDELDRDLLYTRARGFSSERLVRKYPNLPNDALLKLQEDLQREKGR